ncbi:MAG: hypothetical protein ACKOW2_00355 [Sphingobacteriaceae bacterium]
MISPLYEPFKTFQFSPQYCFISGETIHSAEEEISVFSAWFMQRFGLEDQAFKLLDESLTTYKNIKIPCAAGVYQEWLEPLEKEIALAFADGYAAVKALPEERLFQWIAKLVYGIIYHEVRQGIRQQIAQGEAFNLSQSLAYKFGNLHLMLQSLIRPMVFEVQNPWSIRVFKLDQEADFFSYRDEINTLCFSLRAGDFGIIACLQDNGANAAYHQDILNQIDSRVLKPVQFEEICARFFYSAYLFNRLPEYTIIPTKDAVYIEPMPLQGISSKPIFDYWENKTYGQVLENFWKPWGYTLFEIIKDPEKPMSFF